MLAVAENGVGKIQCCPTYQNRRQGQNFATFTLPSKNPPGMLECRASVKAKVL